MSLVWYALFIRIVEIMLKFKNNLRIMQCSSFVKLESFVYSSCSTACGLSFSLSIQYLLFYPYFVIESQRIVIVRYSCTRVCHDIHDFFTRTDHIIT